MVEPFKTIRLKVHDGTAVWLEQSLESGERGKGIALVEAADGAILRGNVNELCTEEEFREIYEDK